MIRSIPQLAITMGVPASANPGAQRDRINRTVLDHTGGAVWIGKFYDPRGVLLQRKNAAGTTLLQYPFTEEDFWFTVEDLQEEFLDEYPQDEPDWWEDGDW